jgi:hypothetical protein
MGQWGSESPLVCRIKDVSMRKKGDDPLAYSSFYFASSAPISPEGICIIHMDAKPGLGRGSSSFMGVVLFLLG